MMSIKSRIRSSRRHPQKVKKENIGILQKILNWWYKKNEFDRIGTISHILGCLAGILVPILLIYNQAIDTKPYTEKELQTLYYQMELVSKGDYSYEDLKDFNSNVYYYNDYYVINYNNEQVTVSEKFDYNGNIITEEIKDKRESIYMLIGGCIVVTIMTWFITLIISFIIIAVVYCFIYSPIIEKVSKVKKNKA